jgi:hypothetical protein
VQGYINALQYNHTGEQYFSINKQRPLGRVMDTVGAVQAVQRTTYRLYWQRTGSNVQRS